MRIFFTHKILMMAGICLLQGCLLMPSPDHATTSPAKSGSRSMQAAYHYSLGVLNLLNEDSQEAIAEFTRARQFDPDSPVLAAELAILYGEKGNSGTSIKLLNEALQHHPQDAELHFLLAGLYTLSKDIPNAIREYQSVLKLDPKHNLAHLYLGTLYAEQKDYLKALDILRILLNNDPDHVIGHYYSAKVLMELKQEDEAEKELKKTLALRPSFESAMVDLGLLYEKQKKIALAVEVYEQLNRMYPSRVKVRVRLGELLLQEKRYEEADRIFREILQQHGSNKEVALSVGLAYLERNRHEQAIDLFQKLLAAYPDDQKIRYLLATAYGERAMIRQAIEMFNGIPTDSEYFTSAQIQASLLLKKKGTLEEALKAAGEAILRKKDAPELYVFLASLYDEKKDSAQAEKILRKGLGIIPKSAEILYSLGVLLEKTGRFDESIQQMRRILTFDPDHADSLNFIGYSYADRGVHLNEAEEMIKRALQLKPGNAYIIDSLGWVYFRKSSMDQAIQYLSEAARLQPDDVAIAEHLGDAYVKVGLFRDALEIYQKAHKLNPESSTLPGKISDLLKK